jgi:hypothetical protein
MTGKLISVFVHLYAGTKVIRRRQVHIQRPVRAAVLEVPAESAPAARRCGTDHTRAISAFWRW